MAVVLFLVALVMIAGGGYAAFEGYGIVLSERGWSTLIAGTVAATGGVLLLGASVIAGRLKRILKELIQLRERAGRLPDAVPVRAPDEPADFAQRRLDPPLGDGSDRDESAREGMTAAAAAARAGLSRRGVPSPRIVGAADEPSDPGTGESAPEPAREARPGTTPVAANDGAPSQSPRPAGADPNVVGTYNSGGNAYVMFSDGSIEADTPTGRYRFKSLEELKEFIANGGEEGLGATRAP